MQFAGEFNQAIPKTCSVLDATDIRERADVIFRQQEAIAKAFAISLADAVRENSPLRFLDEVEKRTIYRADTFWGQVFLGQQRKQAWDLFVKEKNKISSQSPGSLLRMNFTKILQVGAPL